MNKVVKKMKIKNISIKNYLKKNVKIDMKNFYRHQ